MVETSYHRFRASPVPGIDPVDGHELMMCQDGTSALYSEVSFIARNADRDVLMNVSRDWTPSQEHFGWLVRNNALRTGFINLTGAIGPWCERTIEAAMSLESVQ